MISEAPTVVQNLTRICCGKCGYTLGYKPHAVSAVPEANEYVCPFCFWEFEHFQRVCLTSREMGPFVEHAGYPCLCHDAFDAAWERHFRQLDYEQHMRQVLREEDGDYR